MQKTRQQAGKDINPPLRLSNPPFMSILNKRGFFHVNIEQIFSFDMEYMSILDKSSILTSGKGFLSILDIDISYFIFTKTR